VIANDAGLASHIAHYPAAVIPQNAVAVFYCVFDPLIHAGNRFANYWLLSN
jgi:hypothetical protein